MTGARTRFAAGDTILAGTIFSHSTVADRVLVVDQAGRTETTTIGHDASTGQDAHTRIIAADRHPHVRVSSVIQILVAPSRASESRQAV